MKNILLPTDFSEASINAIHYAMDLLKKKNCKFYILNVLRASSFISDDLMVENSSTTIYKTLIDAAKKSIENIIEEARQKLNNERHQFQAIVDYDNFIDAINQVCENEAIDFVVMGTKGASGIEKVLFGSNTVRAMQRIKTPVLAIPKNYSFDGLNTIALVNNQAGFNPDYLKNILNGDISKLSILNINKETNTLNGLNKSFFDEHFANAHHIDFKTKDADIFKLIQNYIDQNRIDLLVMVNKQHSFIEHLFSNHPAETIAFKAQVPLLVIPEEEEEKKRSL